MFVLTARTYLWPKGSILRFYRESGELGFSTRRRKTDLFDTLTLDWPKRHRTVVLGLTCPQHSYSHWGEELLDFAEGRIRYDFEWEGCKVKLSRITASMGSKDLPCNQEFRWKLSITNPLLRS